MTLTDYEHESASGMGDIAIVLGWDAPTDDDGFWFRSDHGPVHDSDLRLFLVFEIEVLRKRVKSLESSLAEYKRRDDLRGKAMRHPCLQCGYVPKVICLAGGDA